MPIDQQKRIFDKPEDEDTRIVIVATNVAETSITIPDVRYVVDTGRVKVKRYNLETGASWFNIDWVSKASADQRAGRAGRIGPGECYRLYSSRVYSDLKTHTEPEIVTKPIDDVVLLLKSYLGNINLHKFPMPTRPVVYQLESSQRRLVAMQALDLIENDKTRIYRISPMGKWMSTLPISVRFSRLLLFASQHNLLTYAVILVSALSIPNLFKISQDQFEDNNVGGQSSPSDDMKRKFRNQFVKTNSERLFGDFAVILGTMSCLMRYNKELLDVDNKSDIDMNEFLAKTKSNNAFSQLLEVSDVRLRQFFDFIQLLNQLVTILKDILPQDQRELLNDVKSFFKKPSDNEFDMLRQLVLTASPFHLAMKIDEKSVDVKNRRKMKLAYKVIESDRPVYIHSSSPLVREKYPYICYMEMETVSKPFLKNVCCIDPSWIPFLIPHSFAIQGLVTLENIEKIGKRKKHPCQANMPASKRAKIPEDDAEDDQEELPHQSQSDPNEFLPQYSPKHDCVMGIAERIVYTGQNGIRSLEKSLELPAKLIRIPLETPQVGIILNGQDEPLLLAIRWFARGLLQGKVFPGDHPISKVYFPMKLVKSSANIDVTESMTASWGLVKNEVRSLLSALYSAKISTRAKLLNHFKNDPTYLRSELAPWIDPLFRDDFINEYSSLFASSS